MSFKSKVLAGAATLALVGGAAATMTAGPANAATPSCGHRCINLFSKKFSDVLTTKPNFVVDVLAPGREGRPADHHVPVEQLRPGGGLHRLPPG